MYRLPRTTLALALAGLLAACDGGDGSGLAANDPPGGLVATFSSIQANVFTPNCATSGCHAGANAPQGLRLDATSSFALLVDVASSEVPSLRRVAPGNPNGSYLVHKLEGTAAVGARMPLNRPPLPQATIDVIRQWITDGASDDRLPSSAAVRLVAMSPLPDSTLAGLPAGITVMFDREVDVSTVHAATFELVGSGGDGSFGDGNEVPVTASGYSAPTMNPASVTLEIAGVVFDYDLYQVRVRGSGASVVLDTDGNALDGEFAGTFPSGDGVAGGDFVATFTIAPPAQMQPTLDFIQANVFSPTCASAGCHSGPAGGPLPAGMDLRTADASFANLVGVASSQVPSLSRVAANDPDNSYLVHKLEGTAAQGERMPRGGPPLDAETILNIRQWISDGARR